MACSTATRLMRILPMRAQRPATASSMILSMGNRVEGVNVCGGGPALYNQAKQRIGALGVSGHTSCADHNIAWRVREALGLGAANVPSGVSVIIYDIDATGHSAGGFGHPTCGNNEVSVGLAIHAACSPDKNTCP